MQENKQHDLFATITAFVATIVILILGFLLFYYTSRPSPSAPETRNPVAKLAIKLTPTNVIVFAPPLALPNVSESGSCWENSIAAPFRADAFRCTVGNSISDPCFAVSQKGFVYCANSMSLDISKGFLIKLTKPLPAPQISANAPDNWAWYIKLQDGTECAPFTGTRPFFGNNDVAYYGCKSNNQDEQVYLMGDLVKGNVWTANEAIVNQTGIKYVIKSEKQVNVDTVWQ